MKMKPGTKTYSNNLVFAAASLGMLLFGIVLISLGSVLPHLRNLFQLSDLSTGSLLSILPFGLLIGSLVFGPVVDRFGYKILLLVCSILVFAGLEGIALTSNILTLRISIFLIGFGGGAINGGANALAADTAEKDRGARLSLLGVFFGVGALGVPFLLGLLSDVIAYDRILFWIGIFVLLPTIFYLFIDFPPPKHPQGIPLKEAARLLKNPWIILSGFILFIQSGMEGLANNWSTTYLQGNKEFLSQHALFSLTWLVAGMTFMRLILGWALHHVRSHLVLVGSVGLSIAGSLVVLLTETQFATYAGMTILGAGLAACFPVIMGLVVGKYDRLSGTALSIVLVLALLGNMLCNYGMGVVANTWGTEVLPIVIAGGLLIQLFLIIPALRALNSE
jgi:FHS family glucose/mannose:H+ symporter-like MFS transporter